MALGIRGFNPIWLLDDLQANLFDDNFYLFVLENTIPYIPAIVYHDPNLNIPWTNPIRFLANGTLPVDIFFKQNVTYRLEFRRGPTQSYPLIYEVNNYLAGGTITPIDTNAPSTDNQITNPQFSLISFSSPLQLTSVTNPASIEVAPGWFLDLTGTGNATISQVPLDSTTPTTSNPPYALVLTLSGWDADGVILRQRFQQNGVLWANKTVSSTVTARLQGTPQNITAILRDSRGTTLATVLDNESVTQTLTELKGHGTLPDSSNTDTPPAAYIEYRLSLPSTVVDMYLTSFQLIVQDALNITEPSFVQDSIDRQIDHTFHYYRESLLREPKDSLLTGWDFALNPWQFTTTTPTTPSNPAATPVQCAYTADQTIIYQQAGASEVLVGMAPAADKYAFEVTALGSNNRFAMIQYIDPATVGDIWGEVLSSLVRAKISSPTHATQTRFKMRLIWRTTLPATIGAAQPISSWVGSGDPVFAAGWTQVIPKNDPVYTFDTTIQDFVFEGMSLETVVPSTDTMTLGIVLYTIDPIVQTATADRILFERISLVPNEFAIDSSILSFDETLRRCQFYYETSKNLYTLPTASSTGGAILQPCFVAGNIGLYARSFDLQFKQNKRSSTIVTNIYTSGGLLGSCDIIIRDGGNQIAATTISFTTGWNAVNGGNSGLQFVSVAAAAIYSFSATATNTTDGYISFHYTADTRLGV